MGVGAAAGCGAMHGAKPGGTVPATADGGGASAPVSSEISAALQSLLNAVHELTKLVGGTSGSGGATTTQAKASAAQVGQDAPMTSAPNQFTALTRTAGQYASTTTASALVRLVHAQRPEHRISGDPPAASVI